MSMSMSNEFLDRLAEAVRNSLYWNNCTDGICPMAPCKCATDAVRIVLEAMREPTPAMLEIADYTTPGGFLWCREVDGTVQTGSKLIWQAMLQYALTEEIPQALKKGPIKE